MKFRLITEAHCIPDGETVTKRTGEKRYTIKRQIKIYNQIEKGSSPTIINANEGCVFLVDDNGNANAYGSNIELVWFISRWDLIQLIDTESEK